MIFFMTSLRLSGINGCFEVCRAKFLSAMVFFVEKWSYSTQNPILWYFSFS